MMRSRFYENNFRCELKLCFFKKKCFTTCYEPFCKFTVKMEYCKKVVYLQMKLQQVISLYGFNQFKSNKA